MLSLSTNSLVFTLYIYHFYIATQKKSNKPHALKAKVTHQATSAAVRE